MAAFGMAYGFTTEEEWTRFKEAFENDAEDEAKEAANDILTNWKTGKEGLLDDGNDEEVMSSCYEYNMKNTIADFTNENACFRCLCDGNNWIDGQCNEETDRILIAPVLAAAGRL